MCIFLKLEPPFVVNVWKKDPIIGLFSPTKQLLFYGSSMEEIKSYSFVMTWGWVKDARIFLFGRSNPLRGRRGSKWASAIELDYSQRDISSIQSPSFILAAPRACKYFRESKTPHFYLNEHLCSSQCITLIESCAGVCVCVRVCDLLIQCLQHTIPSSSISPRRWCVHAKGDVHAQCNQLWHMIRILVYVLRSDVM